MSCRPGTLARLLLALTLLAPLPAAADPTRAEAAPFELPSASVRLVEEVYRLDAVARLRLTPAVENALNNGVDLTITWEVSIQRSRAWWFDADVAWIVQRYRLSLHELSRQYVVTNLNTGQQRSYTRVHTALDQIGTLVGFPLVDRVLVADGGDLTGQVRVRLQHDELPLPLRAVALFSDAWDLASEWYQWRFE
ncbi:MAG: DUF4390 domain-containing protein [Halofilum sp. (in: g-proteobacteria)]|nr:DUF4390 domain-containing protein [Halofilum sp. (in: g-proteobacteria)]